MATDPSVSTSSDVEVHQMRQRLRGEMDQPTRLNLEELREHWHAAFGTNAPMRMSREVLGLALANDLQVRTLGGPSPAIIEKLRSGELQGHRRRRRQKVHSIKTGTRFIRSWQGRTIEAVAREDGQFDHDGKVWRSLSAIARHITGTRWSGPAFFGLGGAK